MLIRIVESLSQEVHNIFYALVIGFLLGLYCRYKTNNITREILKVFGYKYDCECGQKAMKDLKKTY
jgi:hypothetical protein